MRIVIADDEYLIQETLISMIAEFADGWSIVGVASDGKELVDLIIQHQPDLAIIDIKMPYISGIEAIRLTKNVCPFMQWIVLSGYSEFNFAQEAINLGASNYLLKPVDIDELRNSLRITQETIKARNDFINKKFESAMISIGHGLGSGLMEDDAKEFAELNFGMIVFYMDSSLKETEQARRLKSFYQNVKGWMQKAVDPGTRYAFIFLPNGELLLISASKKKSKITRRFDSILQDIEMIMQSTIGYGFCLTLISTEKLNYTALKERMDKLHTVSLLRILYGVNKHWQWHHLENNMDEEAIKLCQTIAKLVKSFNEGSHANYISKANELKTILEAAERFHDTKIKCAISQYLHNTIQCQLDEESPYAEWIQKIKNHGQQLITQTRKVERPQGIIQQALLFIENNYMNDISILQIADELQVTPNYLSTIFHKKMDATFIKYLSQIRLIKAQELLRNSDFQVQVVAEMVGYTNPRYFTRLFTEFTGCYPSEYKKTMSE